MNRKVAAQVRVKDCQACRLHRQAVDVCVTGSGPRKAKVMVVGRMPNSDSYQDNLETELGEVGLEPQDLFFTQALKCRNFEQSASPTDVKTCRQYLDAELNLVRPDWVLALGNEALLSTTGRSGIMKHRARVVERGGIRIFPTISPASVLRNPGQRAGWVADLHLFSSMVHERTSKVTKPQITFVQTKTSLSLLKATVERAELMSFDVETYGLHEHDRDGGMVSLAMTLEEKGSTTTWAVPLDHPQSVWLSQWRKVLKVLAPAMERVPKQIAQNGKFDCRWLRAHGVNVRVTFDTMEAAHLLDENRQKGLKPQAGSRLGVPPWGVDTKELRSMPIEEVLEYNGLDAYYTYGIYKQLKDELLEEPRLARIYTKIILPAIEELIPAESKGIWLDSQRVSERGKQAVDQRKRIEDALMEWVPDSEKTEDWPTLGKRGKPCAVNFNPSKFCKWWLFDHLKLPVLERGKEKQDGSRGDPSMREAVMLELRDVHPAVNLMLERVKWQKYVAAFFSAYQEMMDENDRVHTTFKLSGTVTGRLSSGKEDAEKVPGRKNLRGVNLQQVPRDEFVRGLFGAPPGWLFVEVDFSQIELRIIAHVAPESTMRRLYQTGADIHSMTASNILGIPPKQLTKEQRKRGKAINFGFSYGMGAAKFVVTAFENYELKFTLDEARQVRRLFFEQYRGLLPWHARQRRLVAENRRVQSLIGRVRRLPDVDSEEESVRREAERQAINSPVQGLASDMNTLGMIGVMREFRKMGAKANCLGLVHDATNYEIREDWLARCLPVIKTQMENLPLQRKFGASLDVPIVADVKVGRHWGGAVELTSEQIFKWNKKIARRVLEVVE